MNGKIEKGKLQKSLRRLFLCITMVMTLFAAFPLEASAHALVPVKDLGYTAATDIAATQDGRLLYVTESSSSPIYIMNADGSNAAALGSQTFMFPKYLFVDHNNNIFVLDFQSTSWTNARITKLDSSGNIIWRSNYLDISQYSIMDMAAFDSYVYLVDTSYKVLRIYSYNGSTGNLDYVNGIGGMHPGDLPYYPTGVTVRWNPATSTNEIYFSDVYRDITNGRTHGVFKMNATGGNITEVNKNVGDISPDQIAVDTNGNVYFVDGGSGINKIDGSTNVKSYLLSPPHSASDITVGPTGLVYVTCYDTSGTKTVYQITRLALTPAVNGLSVTSGPVTGGTSVTISGSGFTGATAVTFGGTAAAGFSVNSDSSITATVPARSGGALGAVNVIVTAPGGTSAASSQFTYTPGPAASLTVSASGTQTAGTGFSVTVTAKDQYGNTATGYTGTVHFTTTNGNSPGGNAPSLPGNYAFTAGDAGTHTFNNVILFNKATSAISAADTVTGSIAGVSGNITLNAGAVNSSNSSAAVGKATVTADNTDSTTITVTLKDAYGNPVNGAAVSLSKNSLNGTITPASATSAADGTAGFTLKSNKAETVTYTVVVNSTQTSITRQVVFTPGAPASLSVNATGTQTAGTAFPVTVTAKDQYGNTATGYTGTVHFTTTNGSSPNGAAPVLPADYTFTAGDAGTHIFNGVILYNKAASTISAADTATGSITGTTGSITVNAGAADESRSSVAAGKASVTADNIDYTTITVTLRDTYDNPVSGKTVSLDNGSGSSAISPASAVSGADGTAVFTVRSTMAETADFTVCINSSLTGLSSQVIFSPGDAVSLTVSAGPAQTAGTAFTVTVAAIDQYGNIAAGYTGTIHFTTTNGNSPNSTAPSLPQNYTFTAGDKGVHTFGSAVTLYNAAPSILAAADTGSSSISGSAIIDVSFEDVDADESSITANKGQITADDSDSGEITVMLKDRYGNPVSGTKVIPAQGSGSADITKKTTDISDASGVVIFTVKSRKAEAVTFTASAGGTGIDHEAIITFLPGALKSFKVEAGTAQQAGVSFGAIVTAQDKFGNTITDYRGTVSFSTNNGPSPDGTVPALPGDYAFKGIDAGSHTFSNEAILYNAVASTVTATDAADPGNIITGSTQSISVRPGPVNAGNSSVKTGDPEITADGSDSTVITVKLKDEYDNPVSGENVTLDQGSGSSSISPPDDDTDLTGTVLFTVKSTKAEAVDYTAEAQGAIIAQTARVTYVHGQAKGLDLSILSGQKAGEPFSVKVTVKDADGNTVTDYAGTISFSTNNGNSPNGTAPSLPGVYSFTPQDAGSHTFSGGVTLYKAASCGLTVSGDVYQVRADTTRNITVIHGAVDKDESTVSVSSSQVTANNTVFSTITVVLKDAYGNPIEGAPVALQQNGSSTISPAGVISGQDGSAAFTVKSTVSETVTYTAVTGVINLSDTGQVKFIPGAAVALQVAASKTQTAGGPFNITVTALDQYNNIAEGYTGTVHFSSNNGSSPGGSSPLLPADYTFTAADAGVHVFQGGVTLFNAVESSCTVTDTLTGSITGKIENITVNSGAVNAVNSTLTTAPTSATADNHNNITVTAALKDLYGNPVSGKTVTLSQGSGSSVITPSGVTSDGNGSAGFTVKSKKAEAVIYTASSSGIIITAASISFVPGPADATNSVVTADRQVVTNDGADSADITVTLLDMYNNPVNGKPVTLSQGSGKSVITTVSAVTGITGSALFKVTDTTAEIVTYTASVNGITVTTTASVSYSPKHTVTVAVNPVTGGTVSGQGSYHEGTQVTVIAAKNSGYDFVNWTEGTVAISTNPAITFVMGTADRTLAANFSELHSGRPKDPAQSDYKASLTGAGGTGTVLPAKVDKEKGRAEINLGSEDVLKNSGTGVITVPPISGVNVYTLGIPAASLSGAESNGRLTFTTEKGSITIPENMLSGVQGTSGKEAGITIGVGDKSNLTDEVKEVLGDRPVVQLTLSLNGTQTNWNNPDTPVIVSIPYAPTAAELSDPEHIVVWYLDGSGKAVNMPSGKYDPATGLVTFSTTHFSRYAIAYVHKTFSDLDGYGWAKKPIEVMASKGIVNGTGGNTYTPKRSITRADYLMMLVHTLGITADFDSNFKDVKQNAYYYEAVGIAKELGIITGSGNNKFNPTAKISRQDMMVMTARALEKYKGLKTAGGESSLLNQFSDRGDISGYAAESVAALIKEELATGSGDKLSPRSLTTRAEAIVFLYRIYNKY